MIQLTGGFELHLDSLQFILKQKITLKNKKTGELKEIYKPATYYPFLDEALVFCFKKQVLGSDAKTLVQLGEQMQRIERELINVTKTIKVPESYRRQGQEVIEADEDQD
jgi:hypothetical protein